MSVRQAAPIFLILNPLEDVGVFAVLGNLNGGAMPFATTTALREDATIVSFCWSDCVSTSVALAIRAASVVGVLKWTASLLFMRVLHKVTNSCSERLGATCFANNCCFLRKSTIGSLPWCVQALNSAQSWTFFVLQTFSFRWGTKRGTYCPCNEKLE